MRKIEDEFTGMKVSRQRKSQLRKKKAGICMDCDKPLETKNYCRFHSNKRNSYNLRRKKEAV